MSNPGVTALRDCDGGAQKLSFVNTQTTATEVGERAVAVPLPGAGQEFSTSDVDQVRITFAAEAVLIGAPFDTDPPIDAIGVEIRLDGTTLPAVGDLAFNTGSMGANATLVCARVPAGQHTVQVFWQVFDTGTDNVLTGRLDDWALDVQINE